MGFEKATFLKLSRPEVVVETKRSVNNKVGTKTRTSEAQGRLVEIGFCVVF